MTKYTHTFDIAFAIESDFEWDKVPVSELLAGLEKRLNELKSLPPEYAEECFRALRYV